MRRYRCKTNMCGTLTATFCPVATDVATYTFEYAPSPIYLMCNLINSFIVGTFFCRCVFTMAPILYLFFTFFEAVCSTDPVQPILIYQQDGLITQIRRNYVRILSRRNIDVARC
jgi:hypothetical protein